MACFVYVTSTPVIGAGLELLRIAMLRFFLMTILPFKCNVSSIMRLVILLADRLIESLAETVSFDMNRKLFDILSYDV